MSKGKYKNGDRVTPIGKTRGCILSDSIHWQLNKEKGYLIVVKDLNTEGNEGVYTCSSDEHTGTGDYFYESDLIPYTEPEVKRWSTVMEEAESLIYGDREQDYGSATQNFINISKMWSVILSKEVTTGQVIQCMIALKQCRLLNQPDHRDSWVDICGYAGVWEKVKKNL